MAELDSNPKSIQSLYTWYAENKLFVNRRYQRKLVWTLEEKQKLVESVLRKFPIPAVLVAERGNGEYEVIDGLQRLHTITSFIEGAFPTADGRFFDVTQYPTANLRAEEGAFQAPDSAMTLSARDVGAYLDYSLAISVMRGATDAEIDEVFSRINTYGHRLSDQERRQAGVQNAFSDIVRSLAGTVRGDVSANILTLDKMPSISIDLPMSKHGYEVEASSVFWVKQGILRSTDLRDSMDEQCIADITASIVGGEIIPRSKDALDLIYEVGSAESGRVENALQSYGTEKFISEFSYIIDEIQSICEGQPQGSLKLRNLLFSKQTTNPFPAVFAVLFIALHELLIVEKQRLADYSGARDALRNLDKRIDTSRGSTSPSERRQNINTIKGLLKSHAVPEAHTDLYDASSTLQVDEAIRRSEIEGPHYELKQGILRLDTDRGVDVQLLDRLVKTACAIANNGPQRTGVILLGVADRLAHASKIADLDGVLPRKVGRRQVVGVQREADRLGGTLEDYFNRIKTHFAHSGLSEPLKSAILASLSHVDYFGLGIVMINVPAQLEVSSVSGAIYVRSGDDTKEVKGADILAVAKRFESTAGGYS